MNSRSWFGYYMEQMTPEDTDRPKTPLEAVRDLLHRGQDVPAAAAVEEQHPADGASLLVHLTEEERQAIVRCLSPPAVAAVLEELDIDLAVALLASLEPGAASEILDLASPDVAADMLRALPPERVEGVIGGMVTADDVSSLLQYDDKTAGGLMLPEPAALREWMTAEEAIGYLRGTKPRSESSNYLFVLDGRNGLSGVVGLRDLALASAQTMVRDLMARDVHSVPTSMDQEECARLMQRYDLVQIPVVDDGNHVLGVILSEDIMDVIEEEATEDMLCLAAVSGSERVLNPFPRAFRDRAPWLVLNLVTVLMAALVINIFESTIAGAAFLVVFLPMVASQGGVAGSQTLTLIIRGLALGDLALSDARRVLVKEVALGLANGIIIGLIAGLLAYLWKDNVTLGLVVGAAMLLNLLVAGLFGVLVPLGMKVLRLDPALGSIVVVTTVTDMAGFGFVLALAAWWLS